MPLVKVEIIRGKAPEYKLSLLELIHESLVKAFRIPVEDKNLRLLEIDPENFLYSHKRSNKITIIDIYAFKGRTAETKKKLIKEICLRLEEKLQIKAEDIIILIHDVPLENWGLNGKPSNEINMGFKIDL